MPATKQSTVFLTIIIVLIGISSAVAFYRYIIQEDFQYFTTEEQIPDRFSASSYE